MLKTLLFSFTCTSTKKDTSVHVEFVNNTITIVLDTYKLTAVMRGVDDGQKRKDEVFQHSFSEIIFCTHGVAPIIIYTSPVWSILVESLLKYQRNKLFSGFV